MFNLQNKRYCIKYEDFHNNHVNFFFQSCTNDINEFLDDKKVMDELFGPCDCEYVGIDTQIDNPAITIKPAYSDEYVIWNQKCIKKKYL